MKDLVRFINMQATVALNPLFGDRKDSNASKIEDTLLQRGIKWMFNTPAASHHEGSVGAFTQVHQENPQSYHKNLKSG